ncbi:MAG: TraB/GumN family protein [Sedimenticolaceae bacterium]|nr:TraB/GumN family protein [Sedimenticolaceae bacterium]
MRCHALLLLILLAIPAAEARGLDSVIKPALIELDTEPPSWLFGTIHLPDPRVTRLHPDVSSAFEQADAVYTEIPMDAKSTMQMGLVSLRSDGRTLKDVLPRTTWQRLDERLKRIHPQLDATLLSPMKTWAVYGGMLLFESQLQYPDLRPLDWQLYRNATDAGKEVGGLEQLEEQVRVFEHFTETEQQQMLLALLDEMDRFDRRRESITEFMIQWYLSGDYMRFEELLESMPMATDPALRKELEKQLVYDRNARFAKRIAEKIRENPGKSFFFAIGMGHLGGERSIQALLEQSGIGTRTEK